MGENKRRRRRAQRAGRDAAAITGAEPNPPQAASGDHAISRRWAVTVAAVLLFAAVAATGLWYGGERPSPPAPAPAAAAPAAAAPHYVGAEACRGCHVREYELWQGSDHQLAMQHATPAAVEGDFNNARFSYNGTTTTFFRRGDDFFVNTDGRDGKLHDFQIKYTFGVRPLQQYLVEFPDGRVQALPIAWDMRPREQGGQRWYHLYPGQHVDHNDPLHWTRLHQNWNYMCAECHSTNLKRGYNAAADTFHTTFTDINVACEACHGPGSAHVAHSSRLAQQGAGATTGNGADTGGDGLVVHFPARAGWILNPATGNSRRSVPRTADTELETCGLCHARRSEFKEGHIAGQPLLDTHRVALLTEGLYYPDGQMHDEVFNYGSFLQSKMYAMGVSCSDCHEPHSLQLRVPDNGVCLQCHSATKYNVPAHHHHGADSAGARCAACHMPVHTYMGVDRRHDHSFRVPRPDQSVEFGTPNACNDCHTNKSPQWAAAAITRWFGPQREGLQKFAPALSAVRRQRADAPRLLQEVIADRGQPDIARATAYAELAPYLSPVILDTLYQGMQDPNPLVRLGALEGAAQVPAAQRWALAETLLRDPLRAVRIQAAAFLAPIPEEALDAAQRSQLQSALDEYIAAQRSNADRPEAHMNLALLYSQRGDGAAAEREYRTALRLDPLFVQGYVNLADLYRNLGRDDEGEPLLRRALELAPDSGAVHYALGLLLVRQQKLDAAIGELGRAAKLEPDAARYAYVYAVALHTGGRASQALHVLKDNLRRHPTDRDTLLALVSFNERAGHRSTALHYARKLAAVAPDDRAVRQIVERLEGRRRR